MTEYYLMHKNEICGVMIYDEETGRVMNYQDNHAGLSPFLGNCDASRLRKWWEMRSIPASRSTLQDILRAAGCFTPGSYLAKNLALSMTDSYWIRPKDSSLSYADVNFPKLAAYHGGGVPGTMRLPGIPTLRWADRWKNTGISAWIRLYW